MEQVTISFKNPLDVPLKNSKVSLKAAGIVRELREIIPNEILPRAQFVHNFLVNPRKTGKANFVATFSCDEIFDLYGTTSADVV